MTVYFTESTELSTTKSVARQLPKSLVENVNTEEEIAFDGLNSTSDYSKYYILEQEKETISKNVKVWVKTKKGIWRGRLMLIPYSHKNEDSEHLKIKGIYSQKEEWFLIMNVLLEYPPKRVSVTTQQYYIGVLSMLSPQKLDKEEIYDIY